MYTQHGWQIPGTPVEPDRPPVARCGGLRLCKECQNDATVMGFELPPIARPGQVQTVDNLQLTIKGIVRNYIVRNELDHGHAFHIKTVWFCKTLQNWKAIATTSLNDGMFYELTHNGDKHETYLDVYVKVENVVVGPNGGPKHGGE